MRQYDFSKIPNFYLTIPHSEENSSYIHRALDVLVHSRHQIPLEVLIALEVNGIVLGTGGFTVVAFDPLPDDDDFPLLEVLINLKELVSAVFESNCANVVCQMDSRVIALCCFPRMLPGDNREVEISDYMSRMARSVVESCRAHVGLSVFAAISALGFGTDSISQLLMSVMDILDYNRYMMNSSDILLPPDNLDCLDIFSKNEFARKTARQLANHINAKDFEAAAGEAALFVHSIQESKNASLRDLHFTLLLFANSFSTELLNLEIIDIQYLRKNNLLESLYKAQNVRELINALTGIINGIRVYNEKKEGSRNTVMLEDCRLYVQKHFTNPNLSVSGIADHIGINQTTLSNLFKACFGESIGSMIRHYRVTRAKELLHDGVQLDQVALQSGFGSINTMYRAFKRDEGVPPGKFR